MASAFILMSQSKANELNVAENKRVYVHGCSILNDIWNVTERPDFHSSPAIKTCVNQSLDQADISLSDIKHFDFILVSLQQYKLQKRIGYSGGKKI